MDAKEKVVGRLAAHIAMLLQVSSTCLFLPTCCVPSLRLYTFYAEFSSFVKACISCPCLEHPAKCIQRVCFCS